MFYFSHRFSLVPLNFLKIQKHNNSTKGTGAVPFLETAVWELRWVAGGASSPRGGRQHGPVDKPRPRTGAARHALPLSPRRMHQCSRSCPMPMRSARRAAVPDREQQRAGSGAHRGTTHRPNARPRRPFDSCRCRAAYPAPVSASYASPCAHCPRSAPVARNRDEQGAGEKSPGAHAAEQC